MRDAINARAKRVLKQLFPASHKHIEATASDGKSPNTQISLLEHYIRSLKLKSIVRSDLVAGDVTGQWNLMLDWTRSTRVITNLVRRNPIIEELNGENIAELQLRDQEADEVEETEEEEVKEEGPEVIDFSTQDIVVIPPTCTDLQKAKAVAIRIRMSPQAVEQKVDEGVFILPEGAKDQDAEITAFCQPDKSKDKHNPEKKQTNDAGIKTDGTNKYALVFVVYSKLPFDGEKKPRAEGITFFSAPQEVVGLIKNPLWSGKRPVISAAVDRLQGSFFGKSKIEPVKFLQWNLCDFHNMGIDSAFYQMLPIFAADPASNPTWGAMVMGLAAVWPIAPGDLKKIDLGTSWKDADAKVDKMVMQIWQSLDINEMMMGMMPKGRKNNQMVGAMAQEQSTNINDHASRYEENMLNPLAEMLFEFDQQYRTDELQIEQRGQIGYRAKIEKIPVQQWGERYFFRWTGSEQMMGMQRAQQMIGFLNVVKGIPPQQINGRKVDITPILEYAAEMICGPEIAPRVLIDERNLYVISADIENEWMAKGFDVEVHEQDNDPEHLQSHMKAASINGDPAGKYMMHMHKHMLQLNKKRETQAAQSGGAQGAPGGPGGMMPGGGAAPGVPGAPRAGALPAPGRPAQNPPGAIGADQMADPAVAGRG